MRNQSDKSKVRRPTKAMAYETPRSQCRGPGFLSLVRELDCTCCNYEFKCHN